MTRQAWAARSGGTVGVALFAIVGIAMSRQSITVATAAAVIAVLGAAVAAVVGLTGRPLACALLIPVSALAVEGQGHSATLSWMGFCVIGVWVALAAPPRSAIALCVVMLAVLGWQWSGDINEPGWAAWAAGTIFSTVSCCFARKLYQTLDELRAAQEQLARRSRQEERARIAAEVHDVIGHGLTVTLLHISSARLALDEGPQVADAALAEAERLTRASLEEVRTTVGMVRDGADAPTTPLPDGVGITDLVESYRRAGVAVELRVDGDLGTLGATRGLAAYRIVQEALTNAVRHAAGDRVRVDIDITDATTTLQVDNDCATLCSTEPGAGVRGMTERAQAVGGHLSAGFHGHGWRVTAELPR